MPQPAPTKRKIFYSENADVRRLREAAYDDMRSRMTERHVQRVAAEKRRRVRWLVVGTFLILAVVVLATLV